VKLRKTKIQKISKVLANRKFSFEIDKRTDELKKSFIDEYFRIGQKIHNEYGVTALLLTDFENTYPNLNNFIDVSVQTEISNIFDQDDVPLGIINILQKVVIPKEFRFVSNSKVGHVWSLNYNQMSDHFKDKILITTNYINESAEFEQDLINFLSQFRTSDELLEKYPKFSEFFEQLPKTIAIPHGTLELLNGDHDAE